MKKIILTFLCLATAAVAQTAVKLTDPVCHMQVAADTKIKADYKGKSYSFCSDHCKSEFIKKPNKFVAKK